MKFRFWSDGAIADFEERASQLGLVLLVVDSVAEVPDQTEALAFECRGTPEPGESPTSSGVDGLSDQQAFSTRSDGAKMPFYTPTIAPNIFYKKTPKRSTRGQPL